MSFVSARLNEKEISTFSYKLNIILLMGVNSVVCQVCVSL